VKLGQLLARDHIHLAVVVLGVVGQQHAQAVANGDARGHDEEGVAEAGILRVGQLVERLPGDEHGHNDRLAQADRHLEGDAEEVGVGGGVGFAQLVLDPGVAYLGGDLGEVDGRLQGLHLAEEEPALTLGTGPVVKERLRYLGDADVTTLAPLLHAAAHLVYELVLLQAVLRPLGVEDELLPLLLGRRHGHEVGGDAPPLDDLVGDAVFGELEVARRLRERGVEDRVLYYHLGQSKPPP
jgi:hypothetical protein